MGETFRVENQECVSVKISDDALDVFEQNQITLQNIERILQRIEKAIGANTEKFIPEMSDNKGKAYPIIGEPTANT